MKKICLLAFGMVAVTAQSAVYYDHTTFAFANYFSGSNVHRVVDDLTLGSTGPINSMALVIYANGGYTGNVTVGVADRTGTTLPPPNNFTEATAAVNLTATGGYIVTFALPEASPASADVWGSFQLLNNVNGGTTSVPRAGGMMGGNPTIGTSANLFGYNQGGTGTAWGPWFFNATAPLANFGMRIGRTGNSSIVTTVGEEFGGDLTSLDADDDNQYCSFNDPVTLACSMELVAEVNAIDALVMGYDMIYKVDRPGLACAIYLFKDSTNAYAFNQGFTANTAEETRSFQTSTAAEAADYVSATGQVKMRIDFAPINEEDPSQDGWLHCLEMVDVFAL